MLAAKKDHQMSEIVTLFPRPLRVAQPPLGCYLRLGSKGHGDLTNVLLSGPQKIFGAVFDASILTTKQKDLRDQLLTSRLDVILDPRTQPAAFAHGYSNSMSKLPWGEPRPHSVDDFKDLIGRQRIIKLAEFVVANLFTQVLAPTHYISSPNDQWFSVDIEAVKWLRVELDKRGGKGVPIIYSLAISNALFRDKEQRAALVAGLADLPVDSLCLKVDGFGADAGPLTLTRAMDAIVDFHSLGLPIVADYTGGVPALGLLAFGAVRGIAHGIAQSEKFSTTSWRKPRTDSFGAGWRVYCPPLGLTLTRKEAVALFDSSPKAKALFGNRNTVACPRGVDDMLSNPVRAFVVQKADEIASLGAMTEAMRPQHFLEKTVRPMSDCAIAATKITWKEDDILGGKLKKRFEKHRKDSENLRIALGARAERTPPQSIALQPSLRIVREANA
jgi:hypothetical protein